MTELADLERALLTALNTIRDNWQQLVEPTSGSGAPGGKSADIINGLDRRVSLRHEITLCLSGWAKVIVDDQHLTHHLPLGTDTIGLIEFHERWARWFSGHEAAPDALGEITGYAGRIRNTVSGNTTARFRVGRCPELHITDVEAVHCKGELWVTLRRAESMLPKEIACDWDNDHHWQPHEWASLGRRVMTEVTACQKETFPLAQ